jgi:hypothetical protein
MTQISDHLESALEELRAAKEKAGIGTGLMLESSIKEVRQIKERYDSIHADGQSTNERES